MSLRSELMQETDTFKFAFLASQTAAILKKGEAGISEEDAVKIRDANSFIDNLISGAENLSEGNAHGFASYDAIKALSFVLNPIESLRTFVKNEKLADENGSRLLPMFKKISAYLSVVVRERRLVENDEKKIAREFFEWLAQTLLETVIQLPSASLPQHSNVRAVYYNVR